MFTPAADMAANIFFQRPPYVFSMQKIAHDGNFAHFLFVLDARAQGSGQGTQNRQRGRQLILQYREADACLALRTYVLHDHIHGDILVGNG